MICFPALIAGRERRDQWFSNNGNGHGHMDEESENQDNREAAVDVGGSKRRSSNDDNDNFEATDAAAIARLQLKTLKRYYSRC